MKTTAKRIKQKRIEYNLTEEQLGKMLGVNKATISKWENAKVKSIPRPRIQDLANIFHCDPAWLLNFDGAKGTKVTYSAPGRENVTLTIENATDTPIIGQTALKVQLYEAAANVAPENYKIAIQLLKDLAIEKNPDP